MYFTYINKENINLKNVFTYISKKNINLKCIYL
jgi:hypothetical protein